MIPLTIGFLVSAPLSGWLSDRFGARAFTVGGSLLTALSFVFLMLMPVNFSYGVFALVLVLNGFGSGLFASPNRAEIMNSVPANQRGAAGGTIATFQNAAFVLSIGIFFTLIVTGLSSTLPAALSGGLVSQGIPASAAHTIAHLPPIGVLFAAFLGYNPMKQLLGPLLGHVSASHAAYLTGRDFFPNVITHPFHSGLGIAFWFAIAANLIAAIASLLTKGIRRRGAGDEPLGEELAAVAGEGSWEPSELVLPAADEADGARGARFAAAPHPASSGPVSGNGDGSPSGNGEGSLSGNGEGSLPGNGDRSPSGNGRPHGPGLTGIVRDQGGRPVAGAVITVTTAEGRQLTRALTSPDGHYRITGLPAGALTVIATARGREPAAAALLARPGAGLERDFMLAAMGPERLEREVHGFVRAPGGAPVPGILVTAANAAGEIVASATTDAGGRYRLTGLSEGAHVLVAGGHQPVRASVDVHSGDGQFTFGDVPAARYTLVASGYRPGVTALPAAPASNHRVWEADITLSPPG